MQNDRVLLRGRYPWTLFVPPVMLVLLALNLLGDQDPLLRAIGWLFLAAGAAWLLRRSAVAATNRLFLTDSRLVARTGFVPTVAIDIALNAVESIETSRGFAGLLLGYGTVTIQGGGGSRTRAYYVHQPNEFREQALKLVADNARVSTGTAETKPADGLSSVGGTPWFVGQPLRSFVIHLPAIPVEVYRGAILKNSRQRNSAALLRWAVDEGAWVEKGQVIAEYDVMPLRGGKGPLAATIRAPETGVLVRIARDVEYAEWNKADGDRKQGGDFGPRDVICHLRPIVEEDVHRDVPYNLWVLPRASISAYHDISLYAEYAGLEGAARELALEPKARVEPAA